MRDKTATIIHGMGQKGGSHGHTLKFPLVQIRDKWVLFFCSYVHSFQTCTFHDVFWFHCLRDFQQLFPEDRQLLCNKFIVEVFIHYSLSDYIMY